jgi:hypothetical protein
MRLRAISLPILGVLAATFVAGCKSDSTSVSHTPTHIVVVSGTGQAGNVSAPLDSSLVVQVLDGQNKPVANVPLAWAVIGGGTVSAATTTTDNNGQSTVKWTLAATTGTQVVTVTSTQITGGSVSFVANNGATITGFVTNGSNDVFGATFSRTARQSLGLSAASRLVQRRPSTNRIIVGFKDDVMGVAAAGSMAYRSMSVARTTRTALKTRIAALSAANGLANVLAGAEISPAILAARMRVVDTTQIDAVMAKLRADPDVAWVERDQIVSIRDGAPKPVSAGTMPTVDFAPTPTRSASVATKLPSDPFLFEQLWTANMVDLPRAWGITTGSPSVLVAVVDMGIRFEHADIAPNLTNDGYDFVSQVGFGDTEPICPDGSTMPTSFTTIDGDGNGPDPDPTDPDDLEFDTTQGCWARNHLGDHGLWTAGIIGAVGNEGVGIAGVNWTVKIRPVRVLGITGQGTNFDIAQGILYAAGLPATGADSALVQAATRAPIINMSLGGSDASTVMLNAVTAASTAGSLIVAAAGNDGLDLPSFPASYPVVMGVSAVGMDGRLATYSNAGQFVSVAAPGGDFRIDAGNDGGGGVLGPGWNFVTGKPTYLFGFGTSASAPFVSGVAALLLAQTPGLTAAQVRSRIEQFATRPAGASRSDSYGWGIVDAYNSLIQSNGPARSTIVRLVDATSGVVSRTTTVNSDGSYAFTKVASGAYYVQAGDDEAADSTIGVPGRRFSTAGGVGKPTVVNVSANASSVAIVLGLPLEVEPNDDVAHANVLTVGGYVVGSITPPDVQDIYSVAIPVAGPYTFETSGVVGSCGLGIELDTQLSVVTAAGVSVGANDNTKSATGPYCSRVQATLTPGIYYVTVTGTGTSQLSPYGRYRLQVRSGS